MYPQKILRKRKQFQKGMTQLAQEGAVQIFEQPGALDSFVVGAVGMLPI